MDVGSTYLEDKERSFPVSHRLATSTRTDLFHKWEPTSLEIYRSVYHGMFQFLAYEHFVSIWHNWSLPPFLNGLLWDFGFPPPSLCLGFSLVCWIMLEFLKSWSQAPSSMPSLLLPVFSVYANLSMPFASVATYLQMISTSYLQLRPPLDSRSIYPGANGHLLGVLKASQV